ncbi:MAG TPA: hypothetical protein PLL33_02170 [Paracoccus sp. (in: a-proteobacteria)]|nr:hypothetical protein [Paracoccus sp. (in: a-proteobacteria)]
MRWWNIRLGLGLGLFPSLVLFVAMGPKAVFNFPFGLWQQDVPILILLAMTGGMNLLALILGGILPEDSQAQFLPAVLNGLGAFSLYAVPMLVMLRGI